MSASKSFWDFVDRILIINLDHRQDRWGRMQEILEELEAPPEKVLRIPAVRGTDIPGYGQKPWFRGKARDKTWAARAGCVLSHRQALEVAKSHDRTLILEDDVEFSPDFIHIGSSLTRCLLSPLASDICYLGYTDPWGPQRKMDELGHSYDLWQVFGCSCAHAYLVNSDAAEWMFTQLPDSHTIWSWLVRCRAVDRWYQRHLGQRWRVHCISPSLINQRMDYSDIVHRVMDYAHEKKHETSLKDRNQTGMTYPLLYQFRILYARFAQKKDNLRGLQKKYSGF